MRNFQHKRGVKSILASRPVLALLALLLLFFAYGMFGFLNKLQATMENRKIVENKVLELQKQKEKLTADISRLNTTEGKEENIREKFGMVKEGEGVIVVLDSKPIKATTTIKQGGVMGWFKGLFK